MAVDLLPFRISQWAPTGQVLAPEGLQEVGVLLQQMLDVQPIDIHDALEYLRGMHSGAVGQERIRPHAGATYIDGVQSIELSSLRLEVETSGTFPLDSGRFQDSVINWVAPVLDR